MEHGFAAIFDNEAIRFKIVEAMGSYRKIKLQDDSTRTVNFDEGTFGEFWYLQQEVARRQRNPIPCTEHSWTLSYRCKENSGERHHCVDCQATEWRENV